MNLIPAPGIYLLHSRGGPEQRQFTNKLFKGNLKKQRVWCWLNQHRMQAPSRINQGLLERMYSCNLSNYDEPFFKKEITIFSSLVQTLTSQENEKENVDQRFPALFKKGRRKTVVRNLGKIIYYSKVKFKFQHCQVSSLEERVERAGGTYRHPFMQRARTRTCLLWGGKHSHFITTLFWIFIFCCRKWMTATWNSSKLTSIFSLLDPMDLLTR